MRKKRISRIFNRIIQITQKGKDSYIEYCNYIDDVIGNGEYVYLQDVFTIHFNCDIRKYQSISSMKKKTYDISRFNTNSTFQYRLKAYYDDNDVYQVGKKIYNTDNIELGQFEEQDKLLQINSLGITYSYYPPVNYYKDPDLVRKQDEPSLIELKVIIGTSSTNIVYLNDSTMLLLDKYKAGIVLMKE